MSGEEPKFSVEEVASVDTPPRARVELPDAAAETPADKLERKRDYLEGFLAEKPQGAAAGEPGGDLYEAVIAALYLDGGLEAAARFIRRHWEALIDAAAQPPRDPKTALQEWAQGLGKPLPRYETLGMEGPPHDPSFQVAVTVEGLPRAIGRGPSKRMAEQEQHQADSRDPIPPAPTGVATGAQGDQP